LLRRVFSVFISILLVTGMLTLAFDIRPVRAQGTIYIRADGSIDPSDAPISTVDKVTYTFTGDIINDSIVIERDNIIIDGAGYTLQGIGSGIGFYLQGTNLVTIKNTRITNFGFGIELDSSYNNIISGNNITGCDGEGAGWGIAVDASSDNNISGNNIMANSVAGISVYGVYPQAPHANDNRIVGNNITANNNTGIVLSYSTNSIISGNIIANNGQGIVIESASCNISGNTFINDGLRLYDYYQYYQNSVENNTVNGKPLVYLDGVSDYTVDDAGEVVLVGCNNIGVEGLNLSRTDLGVELWETNNSTISGNNITGNYLYGIYLAGSSYNSIFGNNITETNWEGVCLYSCSNNSISGNNITNNGYGILIEYSSSNIISGNTIADSHRNDIINPGCGITLIFSSSSNSIFHNNFINNTPQVRSADSVNVWDDGYPSGGNYWSDYSGTDSCRGSYQNETGSDGIGDTPYIIDVNNVDHCPLMSPWEPTLRDDWPMFHHDLTHTGYSTSPAPTTNHTLWSYTTGNSVFSSPAVVGGVVYVGSSCGKVYALNATTGAQIWNYTAGAVVYYSSPAVADGKVYFTSEDDGGVYCLDATTGAQIWYYTTGNYTIGVRDVTSPAVAGGVVYVNSGDGKVYALNATTGAQIWNYTTGTPGWQTNSSPAVDAGVVYMDSSDGKVYALNATTGAQIWNYATGGLFSRSSPAVAGGVVYVGQMNMYFGSNVSALNATTGAQIWNYTTDGLLESSPAVAGGVVYIGSLDHNVYALNATTGAQIWNYTTGNEVKSSPAVAGGVVYVGSLDDNVYALNATTGAQIWSYTTGSTVFGSGVDSSPAVAGGVVYVGSLNGKVYAFGAVAHDVAVTNVASFTTVVGQGSIVKINVTVANQGSYTDIFNTTAYASATIIASENVTLPAGNSTTVMFTWNTTGFAYGNYTISAYAWPVPGETYTADNNFTYGLVSVTIMGDVDGNCNVNVLDAIDLSTSFGKGIGQAGFNPNADFDDNGIVNILDAITLANHYNQHYP